MIKVGILGCSGRMGRMLIQATSEDTRVHLSSGSVRPNSIFLGQEITSLIEKPDSGIVTSDDPVEVLANCDVAIDFTTPESSLTHAHIAAKQKRALVIGTTGLTKEQLQRLKKASENTALLYARNMSIGVNLLEALVHQSAATLDENYDIEILEMHHRHKVDAPSGTALMLGEAAASGRGVDLIEKKDISRNGITCTRRTGDIGFAVLRGGDVAGEHSVIFAAEGERLELKHHASDRMIFARGAIKAAIWLSKRPAGFYTMKDALGF